MSAEICIEEYHPDSAPVETNQKLVALVKAVLKHDRPAQPEVPDEVIQMYLRTPQIAGSSLRQWVAWRGDEAVGRWVLGFPAAENVHLINIDASVHPMVRRTGVATALLRTALGTLSSSDRTVITALGLTADSPAAAWAESLGARNVRHEVLQTLDLSTVDRGAWPSGLPAGYRLTRWLNRAPADLLASFATARTAIHDAPSADVGRSQPVWTPERVREEEDKLLATETEQRIVAVICEQDNAVVGLSEIQIKKVQPTFGYQMDTAVLREHRGQALGLAMKADMLRWILGDKPDFAKIATSTAAENATMVTLNDRLGFETLRAMITFEMPLDDLRTRLS